MADEKDTQAATETTDDQSKTETEVKGEQEKETDDLEASLKEFDAATGQTEQKTETKPDDKADSGLAAEVAALRAERQKEKNDAEISRTVEALKDAAPNWTEKMIRGWLFAMASDDSRVDSAFNAREKTPAGWKRVQAGLRAQIAKEAKAMPDKNATEDREAVASHVRRNGNKTSEGPPPKFGDLNNREYQEKIKKEYGYIPRV